jgi:apolipoprotein N-acyltransferase
MPPTPDAPLNQIPLVVDLDGTLIRTDLLWESLARLLRKNPLAIFHVLFWWSRGRAYLKQQLVRRVKIDPATLPFNEKFLAFLREQKSAGRKLVLATASDLQMAKPVADFARIFDEVLASDGKINLRSENKLRALTEKFGKRGFDYAGNSSADFAVWRGAREAIVVNASQVVLKTAGECTTLGAAFTEGYSSFVILKGVLTELFIHSGYMLAIAAGLLLAAAFPKFGIAGFAWVAPALILFSAHGKTGSDAFRAGYVAGISFWLASLYWLLLIPVAGFPILGWLVLSAFTAIYFGFWTWLLAGKIGVGSWTQKNLWSLAGAAAWVGLEIFRAYFLGGFPWNLLGVSQYQLTPLIQIASVTGVYGVSFLVVWLSLAFFSTARAIFSKLDSRFAWQPEVFLPLLVVAILFAVGCFQMRTPPSAVANQPPLRITLVQPSVPQTLIWDTTANSNRFQELLTLTDRTLTNQTDLLIWPESALPDFDDASYVAITNLVRTHQVWMIFNADDTVWRADAKTSTDYDDFNAAYLFAPDGKLAGIYHKRKLVIFGEYIPLVRWLPFLKWFTPITGGYAAGNKPVQFKLRIANSELRTANSPFEIRNSAFVTAAPLICFEDMFPQTARQSVHGDTDFLVNLTNDGWFGEGAEQWQQAAASVFRAVENGVPLVRACNNGVTCWIDAHGQVRQVFKDAGGGIYGVGAMTFDLPLPDEKPTPTFYNRHGDWFGWSCLVLTAALAAGKMRRDYSNRAKKN